MASGTTIAGRKQSDDLDFYETPTKATETAVERMISDGILNPSDDIYEPCCGAGAITSVLRKYFYNVKSSDIQIEDYVDGNKGVDVYQLPSGFTDIIFTNPPYNLMTRNNMLNEFLRIANKKVILILNIYYLSGKSRKEMLESSNLRYVYIHSDRVTMFPYGQVKPKNGGTKMFAWFVWDKEYEGEPIIRWL